MSYTLSNIKLESPLILAPMAGYTDSPFRQICRHHKAAMTYTELISAEGIIRNIPQSLKMIHFEKSERPIAVQIFGKNAESMSEAAKIIEQYNPDFIDINIGCCAQNITSSGSGAALLKDLMNLEKIISQIVNSVKTPVSAKIRIGWDMNNLNYLETLKILESNGISHVAVHGRTSKQRYTGQSNWDMISEIASKSSIPVIGSGDITSYSDAIEKLENSGCTAVMIGRGTVGNPWIFENKTPSIEELKIQIIDHAKMMYNYHGEKAFYLMRKHLAAYVHDYRDSSTIRSKLVRTEKLEDIYEALDLLRDTDN